ncbi:type 1 periplasmic-binding domain-containing protein [Streptomyces acidicola]|uniref:hypothetical protein n=1 Tax=Streptomyces acidicola TaxID=2596892 RepID=UPI001D140371|nr:hypothetical protein [Streptomyces acidicola]
MLLYTPGSPESRERFLTELPVRKRVDAVLPLLIPDEDEAAALRSCGLPLATVVGGARDGFTVAGIDDHAGAGSAATRPIPSRPGTCRCPPASSCARPQPRPARAGVPGAVSALAPWLRALRRALKESRYHPTCGTFPK